MLVVLLIIGRGKGYKPKDYGPDSTVFHRLETNKTTAKITYLIKYPKGQALEIKYLSYQNRTII